MLVGVTNARRTGVVAYVLVVYCSSFLFSPRRIRYLLESFALRRCLEYTEI